MSISRSKIIKTIFHFILFMITAFMLAGCVIPPTPNQAKWTVMVYLDADNNLESFGIQDINEMEMVGSSNEVNIVVQADRIPFDVLDSIGQGLYDDDSNNDWTGTRRYFITQDMDPDIIHSSIKGNLGEKNMGDPETLKNFAQWAMQNYPAERYMLVIWNHVGGFRSIDLARDIAWDLTSMNDRITMSELEEALNFIKGQAGQNIDIVGMDACLMSMVEVAYQIKDSAQIFVSSEASVPPEGWQYDCVLQELVSNPGQSSQSFASAIVSCYYDQYFASGNSVTQSAIDLTTMDALASQISSLAQAIINDTSTARAAYRDAGNASQFYTGSGIDYVDLKDFVTKLPVYTANSTVTALASQINQSLELGNSIISWTYCGDNVDQSRGISIYFPYFSYDQYYNYNNFAQDTMWDEMLIYLGL